MPPFRPKGILLDIDDTLLRETRYAVADGVAALQPLGGRAEQLAIELDAKIAYAHRNSSAEFSVASWLAAERARLGMTGTTEELELAFLRGAAGLVAYPGAREALENFRACGVALGAVSNATVGGAALAARLTDLEFGDLVPFVVSSAELGVRKPEARIFEAGIERIDLPASELWYIGDNWDNDVEGASAAGLFPVWLKLLGDEREGVEHARARSWPDIQLLFEAATG
jgi:HAD superfamily hydrolase (TIGR01549 family)